MNKDAYYFPHDSNATNDPKILVLMAELGLEGYGIYWTIIEHLRDQPEYSTSLIVLKALAMRYNTSHEKYIAVVKSYRLFHLEDETSFYSQSLLHRMSSWEAKRKAGRKAGVASGHARRLKQTTVERPLNEPSTKKGKEKREEDKKGKEKRIEEKDKKVIVFPFDSISFKELWDNWKEFKNQEFNFRYKSVQSEQAALSKLGELSKMDEEKAKRIILQSMANGWKGFFDLKQQNNAEQQSDKRQQQTNSRREKYARKAGLIP